MPQLGLFTTETLDPAKDFIANFDRLFVGEDTSGVPDMDYNIAASKFLEQTEEIAGVSHDSWCDMSENHSYSTNSKELKDYLRSIRIWYSPTFQEGLKRLHKGEDIAEGVTVPRIDLDHITQKGPEGIIQYMLDYHGTTGQRNAPAVAEVFQEIFDQDFSHLVDTTPEEMPTPAA